MRHRRTRDIVIELTSLLDVVMILIFAVMIENTKLTEVAQLGLQDANCQMEKMQEEMDAMSDEAKLMENALDKLEDNGQAELVEQLRLDEKMLNAYAYMDQVVVTVNVSLENIENNRILTFGNGLDDGSYKEFSVAKNNSEGWTNAVNQLKVFVNDIVMREQDTDNEKVVYLLFSADYSKIYSNDYTNVENSLMSAASKNEKIIYYPNRIDKEEE